MLGTLLNYGDEAKTSKLTTQLFYKDSAGAMDEVDPTKQSLQVATAASYLDANIPTRV